MRLVIGDCVRLDHEGRTRVLRLAYANAAGKLAFAGHQEANVDKRTRSKEMAYVFKTAGTLQKSKGRLVTVSPIGELRDDGPADD